MSYPALLTVWEKMKRSAKALPPRPTVKRAWFGDGCDRGLMLW